MAFFVICPTNALPGYVYFFVFPTYNLSFSVTLTHRIYLTIFFSTQDLTDSVFFFISTLNLPAIKYSLFIQSLD